MELKKEIEKFNLKSLGQVYENDEDRKISNAFKSIAEIILSGHFLVKKNNSDSYVTVHPTCVEMYYHEEGEGDDKIKDYIVYHRNSNDGKNKKDIFPLGVLHNHVSGIDLTFERKGDDGNPIRFSALIREFWVNSENKKEDLYEMKGVGGNGENTPDKKPTHIYDALYSQFSVFEGFSIQWVDGTDDERKQINCVGTRINVSQYEIKNNKPEKCEIKSGTDVATQNKKYKQCPRMWRYSINKD